MTTHHLTSVNKQRGSVLPICLVMAAGVGAMVSTYLGRALVEQNRVIKKASIERAQWRSIGQLEVSKNQINNSTYTDGKNDIIQQALLSDPPFIPGTPVIVEEVGPERWYRLVSVAVVNGHVGSTMTYVRDGTSYVAYNYYVERHNLGISGSPRGKVHSNRTLEFFFSDGLYQDPVSASEGFLYLNGATPDNTLFLGGADPVCGTKDLLTTIDFDKLKTDAIYQAAPGLEAEVTFTADKQARIDLYEPPSTISYSVQTTKSVYDHSEFQLVTKTKYTYQWRWVDVQKSRLVWVEGSQEVSAQSTDGYWQTETYVEKEFKLVAVPSGTYVQWEWVDIYTTVVEEEWFTTTIPESLVSTEIRDSNGIFYFEGRIRSLKGELNGKVTLVSDSSVKVTDNLVYVDDDGDSAFLNGADPSQDYLPNPDFQRLGHGLGIVAKGDILYSASGPGSFEVNASMISTDGVVGLEGISVDDDGNFALDGTVTATPLESLRRFGSLMSAKRPISSLVDAAGNLLHGFQEGDSEYDGGMMSTPPPGFPSEPMPYYLASFISKAGLGGGDGGLTYAGTGVWDPQMNPLVEETALVEVIEFMDDSDTDFDWGSENTLDSLKECRIAKVVGLAAE